MIRLVLLASAALTTAPALGQTVDHERSVPAEQAPGEEAAAPAADDPHAGHGIAPGDTETAPMTDMPMRPGDSAAPDGHADHQMPMTGQSQANGPAPMEGMTESAPDPHVGHAMETPRAADAPPPEAAFEGPEYAADLFYGEDVMAAAREEVKTALGGNSFSKIMLDRLEYRMRDGEDGYLWDAQGWVGGDITRLWIKTEGEGSWGESIESAEIQALYSHAIGPWFDLQAGGRYDFEPRSRAYAVVGIQGLVPYMFEVDAAAFLSDQGDLTARIEGEYDQFITQRLILQPRAEVTLAAQDVPELGIGSGLSSIELGARLRYEFAREFAPYIGVSQEWRIGNAADFARAAGEDPSVTNFVFGVRVWF